jgi:acetyl esterase/lipase
MIVCFPSGFPGHAQPEFDPEAQVLADLGFIVLRLNHRYVAGVPRDRRATLAAEVDRLAVHDAHVAIEWVAERNPSHRFDRRRIAALGRGFGGYLAMRALQQEPSIFRCGVAIDAPTDLRPWLWPAQPDEPAAELPPYPALPRAWFDEDRTDWKKLAVTTNVEALTNPLYLLVEPTRNPAVDIATSGLRSKLKALGRAPDYLALDPGFFLARPKARASTYRKIEEFFNLRLYDYDVKIGPTKEVK